MVIKNLSKVIDPFNVQKRGGCDVPTGPKKQEDLKNRHPNQTFEFCHTDCHAKNGVFLRALNNRKEDEPKLTKNCILDAKCENRSDFFKIPLCHQNLIFFEAFIFFQNSGKKYSR